MPAEKRDEPASIFRSLRARLREAGIAEADLEARMLLERFAGISPLHSYARTAEAISAETLAVLDTAVRRRLAGEPFHRILGQRELFGLPLLLSAETLEPRPDTETLVEAVLPFVQERATKKGTCRILDLGTGTGAIALALLSQEARARALGVDVSEDALHTAARNAQALGLAERFQTLRSDWWEKIEGRFDAILSNPPYISQDELLALPREVRDFDPMRALDGGPDGLDAYRQIANKAADHLEPDGIAGFEIGWMQGDAVASIFQHRGFGLKSRLRDLGGKERVLVFAFG